MEIGSPQWKQLIVDGARRFELTLEESTVERFAVHARELLKWNRKFNLTAITDPLEVAVKHYLDSIAPIRFLPRNTGLLDIGSGGGFPGIPLKVVMPDLPVTLVDASRKKAGFLTHVSRLLALDRLEVFHLRAQDLERQLRGPQSRQSAGTGNRIDRVPASFGLIVTRALGSLDKFLSLGLPVLSEAGVMAAYKGRISEKEIDFDRFSAAGLSVTLHRYELPYFTSERAMVIFRRSPGNPGEVAGSAP